MRVFLCAVAAAVVMALAAYFVLTPFQKTVDQAFRTEAVRL
jgi:hypothetical protein